MPQRAMAFLCLSKSSQCPKTLIPAIVETLGIRLPKGAPELPQRQMFLVYSVRPIEPRSRVLISRIIGMWPSGQMGRIPTFQESRLKKAAGAADASRGIVRKLCAIIKFLS